MNGLNKIQSEFYQIGSEIAKCESDIEHTQETETSRKLSLDEIESSFNEIEKLQVKDQEKADQDRSMPEGAACEARSPEGKAEHQQ